MSRSIQKELQELKAGPLYRQLRHLGSAQAPLMRFDGREILNFSSNDYLGLANEPLLTAAAQEAIERFGTGSGASRLICGTLPPHVALEEALAEFKGTESGLTFSSGYATAVGVIGALLGPNDVAILDKLAHASLIDGVRLSGAIMRVFPHNDTARLERHLKWAREKHPAARILVVTESVFSMDGDVAPLGEIVALKERFGAMLLLDEAHAVGVLGNNGRGLADQLGLTGQVEVQMGTLSKAIGASGGYLCGSRDLIELLINKARSFIYSTAPAPAIVAAAHAAIRFLMSAKGEERRQKLWANLRLFSTVYPGLNSQCPPSAIIPVMIGEETAAVDLARELLEHNCLVPAIRYPTVARGAARLRVTLSASHTPEQISKLATLLFSGNSRV